MNVGSFLEIYTTMFGWTFYNTLYGLFNVTGILYLPFLMVLYKNWRDPYLSQDDKPAAVTSQRRMTWGVISITMVFSLAVLPFQPLGLNEVRYRTACTDGGGIVTDTDVAGGTTGTTYDDRLGSADTRIPIIWWLALSISSGLNHAATSSFSCFEDIKGLDQQLRNLTLRDDALREEYFRFANECFLPAKSKFMRAMRGGERHAYVTNSLASWLVINTDYDASDPYFIGSHFYLETDGFYKWFDKSANCAALPGGCGLQAEKPVPGWPYVVARDNYSAADIAAGTPGRPFCDEWWTDGARGLESKLLNSIEASRETIPDWDDTRTAFENIVDMIIGAWGAATYTPDQLEDLVIKRYIESDPPEMTGRWSPPPSSGSGNSAGEIALGAAGVGAILFPAAGAAVGGAALATGLVVAKEFAGFYTMMFVIKSAAPMLQAVLLMMIYCLLLIYLVVSEYDVDSVITALFLILAIRFFTPLWAMADYLDAQLFLAMFPDATWLGSDVTFAFERLLLDMVLTVLYIVAPLLLLYLMQMAGQNIARVGDAGMGGSKIEAVGKGVGGSGRR
ncbi:MAG: conjugal transfer protein TraG N-terminal domain-containing protein [Gammaproteobacteria bacterium]|nr:conjugal transfer protein TraG N-terminal domain-containing protein [Gammaproteobacteria bacterium]